MNPEQFKQKQFRLTESGSVNGTWFCFAQPNQILVDKPNLKTKPRPNKNTNSDNRTSLYLVVETVERLRFFIKLIQTQTKSKQL